MPALSAATEAAAYRIAMEAITNVVRHARACNCVVRIESQDVEDKLPNAQSASRRQGLLIVEIKDDGIGLQPGWRHGVGTLAMRERAEELGGTLTFATPATGGTCVTARLPMG